MDKELIRIIIIATGLLVIVGMLLWGYFRNKRLNQGMIFPDESPEDLFQNSFNPSNISPMDDEDDELDMVSMNPAKSFHAEPMQEFKSDASRYDKAAKPAADGYSAKAVPTHAKADSRDYLPKVIQFSVVSKSELGFSGSDLAQVFDMVGLEYGSMKIYERLDFNRLVDFGVASMMNPGIFPGSDEEMAEFYTPGVTFFMQPRELPDPVLVFDDFVRTIELVAKELDGQKWDAERKPLSEFTIKTIRKSLQAP